MRTFAILLLLLNAGFLAWQQGWLGKPPAAAPSLIRAPFQQAPRALVLLSEIPAEQRALMEQIDVAGERVAGAQEQLSTAEEQTALARAQLNAVPAADPAAEPAAATPTAVAPELTDADPAALEPGGATEEAREQAGAPAVPWCAEVGIFADEQTALAYISALQELGAQGALERREETVSSTWRVHMPSFATEAAARAMLTELQAREIDSFYMTTGELRGGISLGVFFRQESARTAQAQLAEQGYPTSIREIGRLGTRIYVVISAPDSTLLTTPEWAGFRASGAGLQVTEKLCEVIAQENQFP